MRHAALFLVALPHQTLAGCVGGVCGSHPGSTYTKYPEDDTYVAACNAVYEGYEKEPYLLVRENRPTYRTRRLEISRASLGERRDVRSG